MVEKNIKSKAKPKTKSNPLGAGRPDKIDETMLAKLEEGFMLSLTDEECCLYCWINPATLYRYIDKNPAFWKRKEMLKKTPNIKAKENWATEIKQGNYHSSKEWLERKSKDEFSLKTETKNETHLNLNVDVTNLSDEELEKIMLEKFD